MLPTPELYIEHLDDILSTGITRSARGLTFKEIIGHQYIIAMRNPVPNVAGRNLGLKFAVAEPLWILTGSNLLHEINDYGKMHPYSDDGHFLSGAYGPKIIDQIGWVAKTLKEDNGSRQAVLNIWRERPGPSKDIPCTLSLQFMIREDAGKAKLHCVATMRSSDAMMGLPYDSITFSLVSAYLISILKHLHGIESLELGTLTMSLGSSHLYNRDVEKARRIVKNSDWNYEDYEFLDFNEIAQKSPRDFIDHLQTRLLDEKGSGILDI